MQAAVDNVVSVSLVLLTSRARKCEDIDQILNSAVAV